MRKFLIGALVCALCLYAVAVLAFPKISDEGKKLIYPIKYEEIVEEEAKKNDLDKFLVYSVINTESGFDAAATSPVGARGLMQMTDETFVWMQSVLGEEQEGDAAYDPAVNIKYGCALLRLLLRQYENTEVALAAYNAGMGNVDAWLDNPDFSDDGKTLDVIPFEETDNYVKRVNNALENYKKLY